MRKKAVLLSLALLGGCASIVHGTSDQITINSLQKGTVIYVDGAPRGQDVAQADVKRGETHAIRAEKIGCQTTTVDTTRKFDPASLLGILIDLGIISIPVDFIVGGAMQTYPRTYTVSPICKS